MLADPSEQQIDSYVKRGRIYVAKDEENVIGVYVLLETRPYTMEIMNLAVVDELQGRGIGKQLLCHAIQTAKEYHMHTLEIGTGNSSVSHDLLYIKNVVSALFRLILITFQSIMKRRLLKMKLYVVI